MICLLDIKLTHCYQMSQQLQSGSDSRSMRRYLADTKTRTSLEQLIIAESSIAQHRLTLRGHYELMNLGC